ncbi:MAG: hypothetical protein ACOYEV_10360 [Candidatus Nanopelagicales bacterium]
MSVATMGACPDPRPAWRSPDEPIFRNLTVAAGQEVSRYGDDAWDLRLMAQKPTADPLKVDFAKVPLMYRATARRVMWSFINEATPMDSLERATAIRTRLTAGSVGAVFQDVATFLTWLAARGIDQLSAVTDDDFVAYAGAVADRPVIRDVKARRLFAVTRLWLIAPYLPAADQLARPTWEDPKADGDRIADVLGPSTWTPENKTTPLHPQTMSALLLAALRVINVFGPDILAALRDKADMRAAIPRNVGPGQRKRLDAYVRGLAATDRPLPGMRGKRSTVDDGASGAVEYLAATLRVNPDLLGGLSTSGLPIRIGAPMPTPITGHVDAKPWCRAIDYYEVEQLRRMLMIACFIVTAYLSGMRVEECRALRRGCCTQPQHADDAPAHYEIRGHSFKDALDDRGNTIPGGREREHPWLAIEPVAKAISTAESLHDTDDVFAGSCFNTLTRDTPGPVRPQATRAAVRDFATWWNTYCTTASRPHETIPPDPDGSIAPVRFRRTLAWFIYRVPGGRIALGLQYGHLRGYTSDGYASRVASGLRDVFPMEEALAAADTLQEAARRLDSGEQVSGRAAAPYIEGVRAFQRTFDGSYLTARQMAALRRDPALRIYDNPDRALACVYDQAKALCHPDRTSNRTDPARTPDMSRCRDHCANTARTDSHAYLLRDEIETLNAEIDSPLTPEPIRARIAARIERRERELQTHRDTRRDS